MCGLIYVHQKESSNVSKPILKRYHEQKERGSDGFGFATFDMRGGKVTVRRREYESDIAKELETLAKSAVLFHHRYPTSTPNVKDAAHPISVRNKELTSDFLVAHNGIINNCDDLKKKHEALGYKYTTTIQKKTTWKTRSGLYEDVEEQYNDSEALAIELARYISGKADSIAATGSIAFLAWELRGGVPVKLHYGRNYLNPLVIETHKGFMSLRSKGSGSTVAAGFLNSFDYRTGETTVTTLKGLCPDYGYNWDKPGTYGYGSYLNNKKPIGFDTRSDDREPLVIEKLPAPSHEGKYLTASLSEVREVCNTLDLPYKDLASLYSDPREVVDELEADLDILRDAIKLLPKSELREAAKLVDKTNRKLAEATADLDRALIDGTLAE